MHASYRDFILSKVSAAVSGARAAATMKHSGVKGQIREIVIRDLLRPLLPADVGIGTGEIISSTGETSPQQDVVIFDRAILPPITFEQSLGLFPIESVLYAIEVKSNLRVKDLKAAHDAAAKLLAFRYAAGVFDENFQPKDHEVIKAIPAVFAFETSIGGRDVLGKYTKLLEAERQAGRPSSPSIHAICIAGGPYVFQVDGTWKTWSPKYEYHEILAFLSGIMDRYKVVAASRHHPRLGGYIV